MDRPNIDPLQGANVAFARFLAVVFVLVATSAWAQQSGVSPGRVSLPGGPGSLEGLGANASPDLNMGLMSHSVPFRLPEARGQAQPALGLSYSSSGGQSVVGYGWSFGAPSIERMTSKEYPSYTGDDRIAADGGDELVRIPGTRTYRSRFERGFTRWTWIGADPNGREGYWRAEYADGTVGTFGADRNGQIDSRARIEGPDGTFRWLLVDLVDAMGNRVSHEYEPDGNDRLLRRVAWTHDERGVPHHVVEMTYEARADVISDGRPGFDLRMNSRLREVRVQSGGELVRRYVLSYQPEDVSGYYTRLAAVQEFGRGGVEPFEARMRFRYTDETEDECVVVAGCGGPLLVRMGSVGVDFRTGDADFIDINGDGLPDIVTTRLGVHQHHLNVMLPDGRHVFRPGRTSTIAGSGAARLSSDLVQSVDLDGDGFTDLVDGANNRVLWNGGDGDWSRAVTVPTNLPDFANATNLQFFDYNGDARSDVLYADGPNAWVWVSRGDGTFERDPVLIEPLGVALDDPSIQLADMNGDGLEDLVRRTEDGVAWRVNLGWGRFSAWIDMDNAPDVGAATLHIIDLDGDGVSDGVVVAGNAIRFFRNDGGRRFDDEETFTDAQGVALPEVGSDTEVLFVDMNGNGTTDVVWITPSGEVTYLDLYPIVYGLLSEVDNGLGRVTRIHYTSTAEQMALDGGPETWRWRLPNPMHMVASTEDETTATGVIARQTFRYRNGYWDGAERQFRGFAEVEVTSPGDASIESVRNEYRFEVGADDPYRFGLLLAQTTYSDERPIQRREQTFDDCAVEGVPAGVTPAVRHLCRTEFTITAMEGADASAWVASRTRIEWDGFGNPVRTIEDGVVMRGGGACQPCARGNEVFGEPCGPTCRGDERYVDVEYIHPDQVGRWLLRLPFLERRYGVDGAEVAAETYYHYDGDAFVGLPTGQATTGLVSRVRARRSTASDDFIDLERHRYDRWGNSIEQLNANGASTRFTYDEQGIHILAEDREVDDAGRRLRIEYRYDPALGQLVEATSWMLVEGSRMSPRRSTFVRYDAFGRRVAMIQPGDPANAPNEVFEYRVQSDGFATLRILQRSVQGGPLDREEVRCLDGRDRVVQRRTRLSSSTWLVEDHVRFNSQGYADIRWQTYTDVGGGCRREAPAGTPATLVRYDGEGRTLVRIEPDEDLYGRASELRYEHRPLEVFAWDERVTGDPMTPPVVTRRDGLGRTVSIERRGDESADAIRYDFTYDALGQLRSVADGAGNERIQQYDLLGNIVSVDDPDAGWQNWRYDDNANLIERDDASGTRARYRYDRIGRVVEEWDESDPDRTRVRYVYDRPDACPAEVCTNTAGLLAEAYWPWREPWNAASDWFGYDLRGRTARLHRSLDGHAYVFENVFDNVGNTIERVFPDGRRLRYAYDRMDRLTAVEDVIPAIQYDGAGMLSGYRLANDVATTYTYDRRLRLRSVTTRDSAGQSLVDRRFARDRRGAITGISDETDGFATARFRYDTHERLVEAVLRPGTALEEVLTFAYDALDNQLEAISSLGEASPAHVGPMVYGVGAGPRALVDAGGIDRRYDEVGQLNERGPDSFAWDPKGRIRRVTRGDRLVATYEYGPDETRLLRATPDGRTLYVYDDYEVVDGAGVITVRIAQETVARLSSPWIAAASSGDLAPTLPGGGRLLAAGDGRLTAADAWLAHAATEGFLTLDRPVNPAHEVLAASVAARQHGDMELARYEHGDQVSSRVASTDGAGQVVERTFYYPFGQRVPLLEDPLLPEPVFGGARVDVDAELVYFGARWLDAHVGRWMSPDPEFVVFSDDHFANLGEFLEVYSYVRNSPVTRIDPTGRSSAAIESLRAQAAAPAGGRSGSPTPAASYGPGFSGLAVDTISDRRGTLDTVGPDTGNLKVFAKKDDGTYVSPPSDSVYIWQRNAREQPGVSAATYNRVFGMDRTARTVQRFNEIKSSVKKSVVNAGTAVKNFVVSSATSVKNGVTSLASRVFGSRSDAEPTTRPRSNAVVGDSARPNIGRGTWQRATPSALANPSGEGDVATRPRSNAVSGESARPDLGGSDSDSDSGGGSSSSASSGSGGASDSDSSGGSSEGGQRR